MVWKIRKKLLLFLFLMAVAIGTTTTVKADVYNGTVSTTYLQYFKDICSGISPLDDYVFYRSGQYTYSMYVGDLSLNGTIFSGSNLKSYVYTYSSGSYGSDATYNYVVSDVSTYSQDVGSYMVYSNLGDYPLLEEKGVSYEFSTLFVLVVIGLCALLRSIFKFTYRLRI